MTRHEILHIVLTIDTSTAKGYLGVGLMSLFEPIRLIAAILGILLLLMSIIEKYYAIKKNRK